MTMPRRCGRCEAWQHDRLSSAWRDIAHDIDRYLNKSAENQALGSGLKRQLSAFLTPELMSLSLHRIAHWLHCAGWHRCAWLVSRFNTLLHKAHLPPLSCIGPGCRMSHPAGVVFHGSAGAGLTLFGMAVCCGLEDALDAGLDAVPALGDQVTLGAHAVVLGPITLGSRTQVSPFACVAKDVSEDTIVAARVMRVRQAPAT
jgi:serine O-acetyltransferase